MRAPYHANSVCYNEQFSSKFDVGQFKQNMASSVIRIPPTLKIKVLTPKLDGYKILPSDKSDHGTCILPETSSESKCGARKAPPQPDGPINPSVVKMKQSLIEIYTERMVTTSVPWLPGICFLYSYLLSEKSRKQRMFNSCIQFCVILLGIYNTIVSFILWKSSLYTLTGPTHREFVCLITAFCFTMCINHKEIAELILINSFLNFAANIFFLFLIPHIRSESHLNMCTVSSYSIALILTTSLIVLTWFQVDKIDKKREKEIRWKQDMVDIIASGKSREGERRRPGRGKNGQYKRSTPDQREDTKNTKQMSSEVIAASQGSSAICCQWPGCREGTNIGYVSVTCSLQCGPRQYHSACWKTWLHLQDLREDRSVLGTACTASACLGRWARLAWYTGQGREVTPRRLVWDPVKNTKRSTQTKKVEATAVTKRPEPKKIQRVSPLRHDSEQKYLDIQVTEREHEITDPEMLETPFAVKSDVFEKESSTEWGTLKHLETQLKGHYNRPIQASASFEQITNSFGTIGSEKKKRKSLKPHSVYDSSSSMSSTSSPIPAPIYTNSLLNDIFLGDRTWAPLASQLPQAFGHSKILSMIRNNQETASTEDPESYKDTSLQAEREAMPDIEKKPILIATRELVPSNAKDLKPLISRNPESGDKDDIEILAGSGFIIPLDFSAQLSSAVSYVPQYRNGEKKQPRELPSDLSVAYITPEQSSLPKDEASWLLEDFGDGSSLDIQLEEENEDNEDDRMETPLASEETNCFPLTRILRKDLSGYSAGQIDAAMAVVLEQVDCGHIAIPEFKSLVQAKLEANASRAPEMEECHMCLEVMEPREDLLSLDPCLHVFHTCCVRPWLLKDSSCPKCRARVEGQ